MSSSDKHKQPGSDVMEAFRKGDETALQYFFDLHYKSLCYFAAGLTGDDAEAEDIVADCFVKLWEQHERKETAQTIKAFLYISCRNACLNHLKKLKRRTGWQEDYLQQLENGNEKMLQQVVESEFLDVLDKEVAGLPGQCAEVFKLIYYEGRKTDEIAELLDINVKTVRNHKARAVELLRTSFLKKGLPDVLMLALTLYLKSK
ncbi:RNA polymerase sigma-70 factor [Pedobacter nyackensis]|uniref:RNA polymerase sigma factor n=1 Tax=Pedobacter nyackensis TaxID=475255 RepID=UPI00292CD4E8|nr:RNA polymerase sigma-70 factor [Pedobacter nyackensis]